MHFRDPGMPQCNEKKMCVELKLIKYKLKNFFNMKPLPLPNN